MVVSVVGLRGGGGSPLAGALHAAGSWLDVGPCPPVPVLAVPPGVQALSTQRNRATPSSKHILPKGKWLWWDLMVFSPSFVRTKTSRRTGSFIPQSASVGGRTPDERYTRRE